MREESLPAPGVTPSPAVQAPAGLPGPRSLVRRGWAAVTGAIGAVSGVAPHVLHHVGPLAGAALLAGAAGTALFGALGFLLSIPLLLRMRRRFGSWRAPAIALAVFAAAFTLSTVVIGPAIRGGDAQAAPVERPAGEPRDGHAGHH